MTHFLPSTNNVTSEETRGCYYMKSTNYTDYLEYSSVIATRNSYVAVGINFGDASERGSICLPHTDDLLTEPANITFD
jgi:hypothetical protein